MAQDIEKIIRLLNDIQNTNAINVSNFDRILSNISSKIDANQLDSVSGVLTTYVNELSKSVDSKYSNTLDKFEDIEKAIRAIYENVNSNVKNSDMKELFDILSKNINNFYSEARQQKAILSGIEAKISDFSSNKTDKEDILRTISLLRNDMGNINLSYKNTVDDINSTLKSILAGIKNIDPLKSGETIQMQIDIMFKSINDIITNLHDIDSREENFEKILSNIVTSEDLKFTNGIIDSIIQKVSDIEEKLENNTHKKDLDPIEETLSELYKKTDTSASKEDIAQITKQSQELINQTDGIKETLGSILQNIENIPNSSDFDASLKKLYGHIYDMEDSINALNIKSNVEAINENLDTFKDELNVIKNIISDCNDAISSRIIKAVESFTFAEDVVSSVKNILDAYPKKDEVENILSNNLELNTILERADIISQKVESVPDGIKDIKNETKSIADILNKITKNNEEIDNNIVSLSEFIKNNTGLTNEFIKTELDKIKEIIEKQISDANNSEVESNIEIIKDYINDIKNLLHGDFKGELYSKIMSLEDSLVNNQTFNESAFLQIVDKINNFQGFIDNDNIDKQLNEAISEISSLKTQISKLEELYEQQDDEILDNPEDVYVSKIEGFLHDKLSDLKGNLSELLSSVNEKVSEGFSYQSDLLEQKIIALQKFLTESDFSKKIENPQLTDKISATKDTLDEIKQELQLASTDITENVSIETGKILSELEPIKELLDKILKNSDPKFLKNKIDNIHNELTSSPELPDLSYDFEELYSKLSDKLADNENNLKDFILNETDSLIIKFDNLKDQVEQTIKAMLPPNENNMKELLSFVSDIKQFKQEYQELINNNFSDIRNDIKVQSDEIKSLLKIAANHEDIIEAIEQLKKSFLSAKKTNKKQKDDSEDSVITYNSDDIAELKYNFEVYSKKIEMLSENNSQISQILQSISERLDNINGDTPVKEGSEIDDDIENISDEDIFGNDRFDFVQAFDLLQNDIYSLKNSIEEVKNASAKDDSKIPALNNSGLLVNINSKVETLLKNLSGSWLNDIQEYIKKSNSSVQLKLSSIESKLDVFVSDTTNTDLLSEISETISDINDSVTEISPKLEETLSKTDKKLSSMLEELNSKIAEISSNNKVNELNDIKNLIKEQKDYIRDLEPSEKLDAFKKCLDEISFEINTVASDSNADNEQLQKAIKDMKESLMGAVITIFDQVSFIEESEEIKDFVEERTDEINQRITEITKQLQQITSTETNNYTYTMQDIETDLAKLRLALQNSQLPDLGDITKKLHDITSSVDSLSQEEIKELKQEISSLREQTDFLVATSDKSYNVINSGIEGFEEILHNRVTDKVDNLSKMLESTIESDKVIRQALIYIGEWIDSASESINKISSNTDDISKINELSQNLESFKNTVNSGLIEIMDDKFTKYQDQLKLFENQFAKVDKLEKQLASQQEHIDRLEINIDKLVNIVENFENPEISKKIDKIEKQISKLSVNIDKLASYVD